MFSLVDLELARGHWKSGGAAAISVAEAILEPGTDVVIASGDTEQAAIILGHLDGYLDRNPSLGSSRHPQRQRAAVRGRLPDPA